MCNLYLTTRSEIEKAYFEKWCQRHCMGFDVVIAEQRTWTFKVCFQDSDPRHSLLLQWIAALPACWELDPQCENSDSDRVRRP